MTLEFGGDTRPSGTLTVGKVAYPWPNLTVKELRTAIKGRNAWQERNRPNLERGAHQYLTAIDHQIPALFGQLWLRKITRDGEILNYGLASLRVVTTAGVAFIVDAFQNLVELEIMKYHGIGTGTNAEAVGDTGLQTELTTEYIVNSTRATGTTTENAANIYETVATNEVDATVAITEHGIFSAAAAGTLLDRSVFSAVNLVSGDQIQTTYRFTVTAGG